MAASNSKADEIEDIVRNLPRAERQILRTFIYSLDELDDDATSSTVADTMTEHQDEIIEGLSPVASSQRVHSAMQTFANSGIVDATQHNKKQGTYSTYSFPSPEIAATVVEVLDD